MIGSWHDTVCLSVCLSVTLCALRLLKDRCRGLKVVLSCSYSLGDSRVLTPHFRRFGSAAIPYVVRSTIGLLIDSYAFLLCSLVECVVCMYSSCHPLSSSNVISRRWQVKRCLFIAVIEELLSNTIQVTCTVGGLYISWLKWRNSCSQNV